MDAPVTKSLWQYLYTYLAFVPKDSHRCHSHLLKSAITLNIQ
eukprot:COSAG02_NODE_307_length_25111_cov_5.306693_16_plen_42_part_00